MDLIKATYSNQPDRAPNRSVFLVPINYNFRVNSLVYPHMEVSLYQQMVVLTLMDYT